MPVRRYIAPCIEPEGIGVNTFNRESIQEIPQIIENITNDGVNMLENRLQEMRVVNSESERWELFANITCAGKLSQDESDIEVTKVTVGSGKFASYCSLPDVSLDLVGRRASSACGSHW